MPESILAAGGSGQISLFEVYSNYKTEPTEVSNAIIELNYYESILDDTIRASATFTDTGYRKDDEDGTATFEKEDINMTAGEKVYLKIKDGYDQELNFINEKELRINGDPGLTVENVNKVLFSIDLYSKESINNMIADNWVYGRYDGIIPDSVETILRNSLKTQKNITTDPGLNSYNFLGHAEKPFYLCNLLSKKCVPDLPDAFGKLAGYLFYETYDGFNFRSIDKLFMQEPKKSYVYTELIGSVPPTYDGKILEYSFSGAANLDALSNSSAMTTARKQEFDRMQNTYNENSKSSDLQYKVENNGGKEKPRLAKDLNLQEKVTRHFNSKMSDKGILPRGFTLQQQIPKSQDVNFNLDEIVRQSALRYNQLYSHKLSIAIAGDFSLRAGDLIFCDFPEVSGKRNRVVSEKIGGIYMIADLCHRITKNSCYTRLNLVRDSIYRKPKPA